jgi:hypothetical protein
VCQSDLQELEFAEEGVPVGVGVASSLPLPAEAEADDEADAALLRRAGIVQKC